MDLQKKQIWKKYIPQILFIQKKKKNKFFIKNEHISQTILNWNTLWFFIFYQINITKKIFLYSYKTALVTEFLILKLNLKKLAELTKSFYIIGPWKNSFLTNIYWYKYLPQYIINFGMFYIKNYINEISILCIPNLFFFNTLKNIKYFSKVNYFFFLIKVNYIFFFTVFFLFNYLFKNILTTWLIKIQQIKTEFFIGIQYIKKFRAYKKRKIFLLTNNTIKDFLITIKLNIKKAVKKIFKYNKIKTIKNLILIIIKKKKQLKKKLFFNFLKIKKIKKTLKDKTKLKNTKIYFYFFKKSLKKKHKKKYNKKNIYNIKIKKNLKKWLIFQFIN